VLKDLEDWKEEERKRVSPNTTEHRKVCLFGFGRRS